MQKILMPLLNYKTYKVQDSLKLPNSCSEFVSELHIEKAILRSTITRKEVFIFSSYSLKNHHIGLRFYILYVCEWKEVF